MPILVCGKSAGIHIIEEAFRKGYPGWSYDYGDTAAMKQRIYQLYQGFKNKNLAKGKTPYTECTRKNLTGKLATLIHDLCDKSGVRPQEVKGV
jgi:hypothetical protein